MTVSLPRLSLLLSCVCFALLSAVQSNGQAAASSTANTHAPDPDAGMSERVSGLFIPLITGQPFRAKINVQVTRLLPDGTKVEQKYYTQAARDTEGHEYREARDMVPASSDREPALIRTTVYDPKTSLVRNCFPAQQICRQMQFDATSHPVDEPVGPSSDGKSVLARESLGKKQMLGLEVEGTRETVTFKAGAFGNDKPVVVTKEIWYSPRLQFNVAVTRDDPRNGMQKFEVSDLKLGDPEASWFTLPDGYRLVSGRGVLNGPVYPAELEPLIEKNVPGMSKDELSTALAPVEAAIGAYARAHAAASPNDKTDAFAGQLRMQLSMSLQMVQRQSAPPRVELQRSDLRLNQMYQQVLDSPCLAKTQPGDPPSMPANAEGLRSEQLAWTQLRDAWVGFLTKLFPNGDPSNFAWQITNQRESDLRRIQNVERNRGCIPEESIGPMLEGSVNGLSPDQFTAALKPLDASINAYAKAHAESAPHDNQEFFARGVQQRLSMYLRFQERNQPATQDQFEEADLHLNQAWRAIIGSPCLDKSIPADPPNAPVSADKLRAEQRAWIAMRDAWANFAAAMFPNAPKQGLAYQMTEERAGELRQIQGIEVNRGCPAASQ